ncbi:conserved hypothetical protein [Bathymodiolus platifrons methanotrophic gill symbiont]|uniref:hypothetical protein n=1 Tax=Bathymodiolus platifrons methanotrophic gill symbiont TaxID=113268 RepID=UPI000B41D082|nr:hypothetical protein [Bathymodiolus platifrons methanotrophic gill symbiont]TXL00005.1 hypothetical protein BMR02_06710 [Methylococcaceae bacterium HT1]TXL16905.1 hypothetical protein BMR04_08010 [Methylococcaceae bacterium HT3]TXL22667.1 hypothetical protein BMR03_06925 [Methylococcaceae bacterium HT2]GAW86567.1 conserved hypothetical protein [Bathymodiolus platifrons methanotrophic gill symbiont]GFO75367.1 hypothetical protein BPLS_P2564 [Bathymodiolus platifrons methanotrophic gill symbi
MLINTLSALFAYTTFISPIETAIILLITAYIIYILTPERQIEADEASEISNADTSIYLYIQSAWLGRASLIRAFLPFFIIFNSALFYADYRSDNGTYTIASWLTILVILALPVLWWIISVWRCSCHDSRIWASTARFVTVAVFYEYVLRVIIAYVYPQIWFNCQQLIIEYGDCL